VQQGADGDIIDLRDDQNAELLKRVRFDLYEKMFPEDEQEDASKWEERLTHGFERGSMLRIAVRVQPTEHRHDEPVILGFVCSELYPKSKCGLISYVGTDPDRRKAGTGRKLIEHAIAQLEHDTDTLLGGGLAAIFAEVHRPDTDEPDGFMDQRERWSFFGRLDARKVPIDYVQPPLTAEDGTQMPLVTELALLSIPPPRVLSDTLPSQTVATFLEEYFVGEGLTAGNPALEKMRTQLGHGVVKLEPLHKRVEKPELQFDHYGIALHYVDPEASKPTKQPLPPADEPFRSFERDVLAYAYRNSLPLSTRDQFVHRDLRTVTLEFANEISYSDEGDAECLVGPDKPDQREVEVRACETRFKSGVGIKHLIFSSIPRRPGEGSATTSLNEFDVIKLVKLWEGGEDVDGVFCTKRKREDYGANCVRVVLTKDGGERLTVDQFAARIFGRDPDPNKANPFANGPKAGTVELSNAHIGDEVWEAAGDVAAAVEGLETKAQQNHWETNTRPALEALGGIVQGLLDFDEIDDDELADVFGGAKPDGHSLEGMHKGTLLAIEAAERPGDTSSRRTYPVSPYRLLPQALLLHNDALLERANAAWTREHRHTADLRDAADEIRTAIDSDFLPNVFHYQSEREHYKNGFESRAIGERREQFRARLQELDAAYNEKVNQHRRVGDSARNLLLLGLSYTTLRSIFPDAPTLILVGALAVVGLTFFIIATTLGETHHPRHKD
jgi:hypothetical protein